MTAPAPVSHAPDGYVCPFCGLVAGDVSDPVSYTHLRAHET